MINESLDTDLQWTDEEGRRFKEVIRQHYTGNNCVFSGGVVEGHSVPEDTFYLKWAKDGVEDTLILMRPDEVAAVNWICAGLLWTETMDKV
jgi:hypothetical protein